MHRVGCDTLSRAQRAQGWLERGAGSTVARHEGGWWYYGTVRSEVAGTDRSLWLGC